MRRSVGDVMTRNVVVVPDSAPFKHIVRTMREHNVSAVPVTDADGAIAGVVSEADLMLREDPSVLEPHFFEGHIRREERRKAEALERRIDELEARIDALRSEEELASIRPDLDGAQVMAHLGVPPGPVVGRALAHLLEVRLDEGPLEPDAAFAELDR